MKFERIFFSMEIFYHIIIIKAETTHYHAIQILNEPENMLRRKQYKQTECLFRRNGVSLINYKKRKNKRNLNGAQMENRIY